MASLHYKERYKRLKERVAAFKIDDKYLYQEYLIQIKTNGNKALIDICINWNDYAVEYIDLIVVELHEKNNYALDTIYCLIKEKPIIGKEVKKRNWPDSLLRILLWILISVAVNSFSHKH